MAIFVKLIAPFGISGIINGTTSNAYAIASDRTVTVDSRDAASLVAVGFQYFATSLNKISISSPLPADLVSIVAAVSAVAGPLTIAAQPIHSRKLQYRVVWTSGSFNATQTTVGFDQDGNAITEVITWAAIGASTTVKSAYAWSNITSSTLSAVSGTYSVTIGIGVSNDFGLVTFQTIGFSVDLAMVKSTKITKVLGTSNTAVDDVASSGVLDTIARTFAPTTAPTAGGLVDYEFTYAYAGN
jgi:hypothetical protein